MNKIIAHFVFLMVAAVVFSATQLHAGLAITPARSEVNMVPGTSCSGSYTVRNDYTKDALIEVAFRDWFTLPENEATPLSQWVSVEPSSFSLKSGESKQVNYTVHMPTGITGVSVDMLSFTPSVAEDSGVTMMMSVSLYVTAKGTEKAAWDVEDIKVTKSPTEFRVSAVVKNSGNVHVRPAGNVAVFTAGNVPVCSMNINEGRPVYPGASRPISAYYTNVSVLKAGFYTVVLTVDGAGEQKTKKIKFKINKAGEVNLK